ncbi:MAG: helix-turn-helix domain-containing protein [Cruoricaptor ignavus]|nr:helix-turn-helix domain-containing protein [Cruoricaptor ignavus]
MHGFLSFLYVFLVFVSPLFLVSAQENSVDTKKITYDELNKLVNKHDNQLDIRNIYVRSYIVKAKKENNLKELAHGYNLATHFIYGETQIKYADSALAAAKQMKDPDIIGEYYIALAGSYRNNEEYPKALEHLLKGYEYVRQNKNPYLLHEVEFGIAQIKTYLGQYDEAQEHLQKCVAFFRSHDKIIGSNDYRIYFIYSLIALTEVNTYLSEYEKNIKLIEEGRTYIQKNKMPEYAGYFFSAEGTDAYYQKKYTEAIAKLQEALQLYNDNWQHLSEKFYLGLSYWELGDKEKALSFLQEIDQNYEETKILDPHFRPVMERFISYYADNNQPHKQLEYINKLMVLDKGYEKKYKHLFANIKKEYDTKQLIEDKEKLENSLKTERSNYTIVIVFAVILLGCVSLWLLKFYRKKNQYKKMYEEVFQQVPASPKIDLSDFAKAPDKELDINSMYIEKVSGFLETFESEQQFLKPGITLESISKTCGVNKAYFSKILNHFKGFNLNAYLNHLRLNHIIQQWKTNPETRDWSMQHIAEESGYNNAQSFSKNFKDRFGISPAYFLENLSRDLPM